MEFNNIASISCFVCDEQTHLLSKNIGQINSKHSATEVHKFIEKFIGQNLDEYVMETSVICKACLDKINEYDLAIVTSNQVEKELCEKLVKTHNKMLEEDIVYEVKYEIEDEDNDVEIGEIISAEQFETVNVDLPPNTDTLAVMKCNICNTRFSSLAEMQSHKHDRLIPPEKKTSCVQILRYDPETDEYSSELDFIEEEIDNDNDNDAVYLPEHVEHIEVTKSRPKTLQTRTKSLRTSTCYTCNKDFLSKTEYKVHMKSHHFDQKFDCNICGVSYKSKSGLDVHIGLHKGLSPHQCTICNKKFTQKGALVRHMPIHSGEKPYQCDKCGKQFLHYSSFHMHQLAHDNIREKKCEVCGFELRSNSHLTRHMRVHSGEKPFECPTCGQKFAQRYNMMTHYKSHQGIHRVYNKVQTCIICNAVFQKKSKLEEHIANAHGCTSIIEDIKVEEVE